MTETTLARESFVRNKAVDNFVENPWLASPDSQIVRNRLLTRHLVVLDLKDAANQDFACGNSCG